MSEAQAEVRVLAATGMCGSGFRESSFEAGLSKRPHFIGCDAGSTDAGPAPLGSGKPSFPDQAMKRDLRLMIKGGRRDNIPVLVGSAGSAGGAPHLSRVRDIVLEIAAEENLSFRLALIHAEQDKAYLKKRLNEGRIKPLKPALNIDDALIERSERIVGMMGEEPFLRALDKRAQVVIAGRASDCAIYAGIPVRMGIPAGLAWHAAKILECGAASVVQRTQPDCMFATLRSDHFELEPLDPAMRATPQSIASHSLYENSDPFHLVESNGTLDLTDSDYEAIDDRRVRVRGSKFIPSQRYTVKLEGAERVGYQSILIGGVRDGYIIRQLDDWLAGFREKLAVRIADVFGNQLSPDDYVFNVRTYGVNGVMGPLEPVRDAHPHEVCLVLEATAPSQEIATGIVSMARHQLLHLPIPEWSGLITTIACPYNPSHLERGLVYRFCLNHVIEPDDPYEMFPIEYVNIERGRVLQ
jgi:hypothetical protein